MVIPKKGSTFALANKKQRQAFAEIAQLVEQFIRNE